jgi:hypothetical protein
MIYNKGVMRIGRTFEPQREELVVEGQGPHVVMRADEVV